MRDGAEELINVVVYDPWDDSVRVGDILHDGHVLDEECSFREEHGVWTMPFGGGYTGRDVCWGPFVVGPLNYPNRPHDMLLIVTGVRSAEVRSPCGVGDGLIGEVEFDEKRSFLHFRADPDPEVRLVLSGGSKMLIIGPAPFWGRRSGAAEDLAEEPKGCLGRLLGAKLKRCPGGVRGEGPSEPTDGATPRRTDPDRTRP